MPERLPTLLLPDCPAERFARLVAGSLPGGARGPLLIVAELAGEALLLGRHQRRRSALAPEVGVPIARRAGGGRTIRAGDGVLAIALLVPHAGALLDAPVGADRALNRYVRPIIGGLSRFGATLHWFGRDWISSDKRQVGVISQEGSEDGAVLIEAYLAVERTLEVPAAESAYPRHGDPRAAGAAWTTLRELGARPAPLDEIAAAIAARYGEPELLPAPPPEAERDADPAVEEDEASLAWSGVADVPIGFAEALARLDGAGRFAEVRLRGDFLAPAWMMRRMERGLAGKLPVLHEAAAVVRDALAAPHAFMHGIVDAGVLAEAACAAVAP